MRERQRDSETERVFPELFVCVKFDLQRGLVCVFLLPLQKNLMWSTLIGRMEPKRSSIMGPDSQYSVTEIEDIYIAKLSDVAVWRLNALHPRASSFLCYTIE